MSQQQQKINNGFGHKRDHIFKGIENLFVRFTFSIGKATYFRSLTKESKVTRKSVLVLVPSTALRQVVIY